MQQDAEIQHHPILNKISYDEFSSLNINLKACDR
jgi:hypothetical protein